MNNILILTAGRRVELVQAFQQEVKKRHSRAKVFASDLRPKLSSACQVADGYVKTGHISQPEHTSKILDFCVKNNVSLVIPTIDTGLVELSQARNIFSQSGIHLIVSDPDFVRSCRDKRQTAILFASLGIESPEIYHRNNLRFPCFAKPYSGSNSVGAFSLSDAASLTPSIVSDESLMFMELMDDSFKEYSVDAYYSDRGELKCMVPRERIEVRGGEVNKGITRRNFVYSTLLKRLRTIQGARGCLTMQFFVRKADTRISAIEINPRFGGGFPLSFSAGANYPGWLIDEYIKGSETSFFDDWEEDLLMLRYDAKVLIHEQS